jgi:hypothetical protein
MTMQQTVTPPSDWTGSVPEFMVFTSLVNTFKKVPGLDFSYQNEKMGGRLDKGGLIIDFIFNDPPDLAINVQGEYYHYGKGKFVMQNDIMIRQILAGQGIDLIFIDENDILKDVDYYVREALNKKDHSKLGGGI